MRGGGRKTQEPGEVQPKPWVRFHLEKKKTPGFIKGTGKAAALGGKHRGMCTAGEVPLGKWNSQEADTRRKKRMRGLRRRFLFVSEPRATVFRERRGQNC